MEEKNMMDAFRLISDAGDASSKFTEAMEKAESGNFEMAQELILLGEKSLIDAHQKQTDLLHAEAQGNQMELSLLMVHAQDHLMNAMLLKEFSKRMLNMSKKIFELEDKK